MTAVRSHAKEFIAVVGLVAIAVAVSLYLLNEQRMRFPWEPSPLVLQTFAAPAGRTCSSRTITAYRNFISTTVHASAKWASRLAWASHRRAA